MYDLILVDFPHIQSIATAMLVCFMSQVSINVHTTPKYLVRRKATAHIQFKVNQTCIELV